MGTFRRHARCREATKSTPLALVALPAAVLSALMLGHSARGTPTVESASAGPVTASLSYDRVSYPPEQDGFQPYDTFTRLEVSITRAGNVVYTRSLYDRKCEKVYCHPANRLLPSDQQQSVLVRDLDADGEPEVIVDLRLGGAHDRCYTIFYRYTAPTYTPLKWLFNEPCYSITQPDRGPVPELVTRDTDFTDHYALGYADWAWPPRVWHYRHGRLVNVTRRYPTLVRTNAALDWRSWRRHAHDFGGALGVLAVWTADEYLLGHRDHALRVLRRLAREGRLTSHGAPARIPTGLRYIHTLDIYLRRHGYRPRSQHA